MTEHVLHENAKPMGASLTSPPTRKSKYLLLWRIFLGFFVFLLLACSYVMVFENSFVVWGVCFLGFSILSGALVVRWLLEHYTIKMHEVEHRKGIFFVTKEIILLKNIEKITLQQSVIGKLLHYGSISLYAPTIRQDFIIHCIENPEDFIRTLEAAVHAGKSQLEIIRA